MLKLHYLSNQDAKLIRFWLIFSAFALFLMVIIGGATRLTGSGLSMVEWEPLNFFPPITDNDWLIESLADSVIYMSFYVLALLFCESCLAGKKQSPFPLIVLGLILSLPLVLVSYARLTSFILLLILKLLIDQHCWCSFLTCFTVVF